MKISALFLTSLLSCLSAGMQNTNNAPVNPAQVTPQARQITHAAFARLIRMVPPAPSPHIKKKRLCDLKKRLVKN